MSSDADDEEPVQVTLWESLNDDEQASILGGFEER